MDIHSSKSAAQAEAAVSLLRTVAERVKANRAADDRNVTLALLAEAVALLLAQPDYLQGDSPNAVPWFIAARKRLVEMVEPTPPAVSDFLEDTTREDVACLLSHAASRLAGDQDLDGVAWRIAESVEAFTRLPEFKSAPVVRGFNGRSTWNGSCLLVYRSAGDI